MKIENYNPFNNLRKVLVSIGLTLIVLLISNSLLMAQFGASPWTATSGTFTVPAGVTSITVNATGGGGAGGSGKSFSACNSDLGGAGGGGGGGFSTGSLTVVSGQTITVVVGNGGVPGAAGNNPGGAGGASSVTYSGGGSVSAGGGGGGGSFSGGSSTTPGTAGAAGIGTTHNGGQGGAGNYGYLIYDSGGGGGGAGSGSNGSAGNNTNGGGAGGGGTYPGGAGATGSGSYDSNGNAGTAPGGGGAGELAWCANKQGGAGGAGQVIITYSAPVFSISSITPSSGCAGSTITINGVNLSAATAVTIGGVAVTSITTNTATQITAVVGSFGSGVVAVTNSNGTATSPTNFTVTPAPAQPGAISGGSSVCANTVNTFSVTAVAGATFYTWTVPGTWPGTSVTNSINVTPDNTPGTISVTANNACGSSTSQSIAVSINTAPAMPAAISGSPSICQNSSQSYSIGSVTNATSYTWTLPSSWSGTSVTNSITATSNTTGGTISVTANNTCGSSAAQSTSVAISPGVSTPSAISGPTTVCSGNSSYTVINDPNATSYTWSLPSGWSGTSTTDSIYATVGSSAGTISVIANGNCGSSTAQTLVVSIVNPPAQPSSIVGVTHLCDSSSTAYAVTNDPSAIGYTWTLPSGWSGSSTTSTITATADTSSGIISVTANNACGPSTTSTLNVVGNTIPAVTVASFGTVCDNLSSFSLTGGNPAGGYYSGTAVNSNSFDPSISGDGTFFITYTYANGACVRADSAAIMVDNCTAINNYPDNKNIAIYPNPTTGNITVSIANPSGSDLLISVDDIQGRIVYSYAEKNPAKGTARQINLEHLAKGIYYIKLTNGGNNQIQKLIID